MATNPVPLPRLKTKKQAETTIPVPQPRSATKVQTEATTQVLQPRPIRTGQADATTPVLLQRSTTKVEAKATTQVLLQRSTTKVEAKATTPVLLPRSTSKEEAVTTAPVLPPRSTTKEEAVTTAPVLPPRSTTKEEAVTTAPVLPPRSTTKEEAVTTAPVLPPRSTTKEEAVTTAPVLPPRSTTKEEAVTTAPVLHPRRIRTGQAEATTPVLQPRPIKKEEAVKTTPVPLRRLTRKGEAASICQICENGPKVKWKCLECELMMCQRCEKVHQKFLSANDHTVIDIRDMGKYESKTKQNFNKIVCVNHKTQNCCMFCKSCDKTVCPVCIATTHKRHDLIELCEGYAIKMAKNREQQEKIDSTIHNFTRGVEELREFKYQEQARCKRTRIDIRNYEQTLSDAVKIHVNKLLDEVDQKLETFTKTIDKEETKWNKACLELTEQRNQVNDLLHSHDADKVFTTPNRIIEQFIQSIFQGDTTVNHVPEFVAGNIFIIPELVGSLKRISNSYSPVPSVKQWYSTDVKRCNNIISCPGGLFWINDKGSKQLQIVNPTAEVMKVVYNFDIGVNDLSLMTNGDLLICLMSNQSILKVISVGTLEIKDSPYNVSPYLANCIHVTHENKVIVGVKNNGPVFPASGPRQVIVMDHTGKQKQVYECDNQNRPLFTLPVRVHSNKLNIIGVIDWINEECEGRIVILNQEGFLQNVYMGPSKIYRDANPFKPSNILSLPSDNFIITDPTNHYLHILNTQGNILAFYNLVPIGIEFPYSMTFFEHLFI